ncbi:MAG: group II intron reverse transcriptase/maturase, partial [Anaerolineae bacterium]|nr:group II intron reverse transcriptase/maturase [Anaerolineae bacterium]
KTFSGTPQGRNLSPLLSNIYLHELDRAMQHKIAEFHAGKRRAVHPAYRSLQSRKARAKTQAQRTGDWKPYKALQQELSEMECTDPQDPNYRRLRYVRYADDFLIGVSGSKADAEALKAWLAEFLKTELQLELALDKTLITNAKDRVRFLGYDIQRWHGTRILKSRHRGRGMVRRRSTNFHLKLLMPKDKVQAFARTYGSTNKWEAKHRNVLLRHSDLEIMMIFNAEVRGFLNYYALADNFSVVASRVLWLTTNSFLKTLGGKHKQSRKQVVKRLKTGSNTFTIVLPMPDGTSREYRLLSSTRQVKRKAVTYPQVDRQPTTWRYRNPSDLVQRLLANECEWCGTTEGLMEVHHVRRLKDLKGKEPWEIQMIARRRKTMVLCRGCHHDLHNGKLGKTKCKTR